MVIKQRTGWGYETLVREVSDSLHLRRFCLIALTERVPDESTVRKLTRRLGAEVVEEISREVIAKATAASGASCARGADRLDRGRGRRALSRPTAVLACRRDGRWRARAAGSRAASARQASGWRPLPGDRPAAGAISTDARAAHRRGAERGARARPARPGALVARSIREARRLADRPRARARGRGAQAKLRRPRGARGARRARQRVADRSAAPGRREDHRPARLARRPRRAADPQGQAAAADRVRLRRPARRGDARTPVAARAACILPAATGAGNPGENTLLPGHRRRARALGAHAARARARRRLLARPRPPSSSPRRTDRIFIAGRQSPARGAPDNAWRATASASRGASATSSAATACDDPPQGPPGPAHLDRLGDPRLQPRHPRHPQPPDRIATGLDHPSTTTPERPRPTRGAAVLIYPRLSGASN